MGVGGNLPLQLPARTESYQGYNSNGDDNDIDHRREDTRDKEFSGRCLGKNPVDNHDDAGRDQNGQSPGRSHDAGGQAHAVTATSHFRHSNLGEGRTGGQAGACGSSESGVGKHRSDTQSSRQMLFRVQL